MIDKQPGFSDQIKGNWVFLISYLSQV